MTKVALNRQELICHVCATCSTSHLYYPFCSRYICSCPSLLHEVPSMGGQMYDICKLPWQSPIMHTDFCSYKPWVRKISWGWLGHCGCATTLDPVDAHNYRYHFIHSTTVFSFRFCTFKYTKHGLKQLGGCSTSTFLFLTCSSQTSTLRAPFVPERHVLQNAAAMASPVVPGNMQVLTLCARWGQTRDFCSFRETGFGDVDADGDSEYLFKFFIYYPHVKWLW